MHASKKVVWIVSAIIGLIVLLLIFRAGMLIGYRQAEYSLSKALSPRGFFQDAADNSGFLNDHGAIGPIVSIMATSTKGGSLVVHDTHDNADKTVLISETTAIFGGLAGSSTLAALEVGENVAVIGAPDSQGEISASIIRVVPLSQQH